MLSAHHVIASPASVTRRSAGWPCSAPAVAPRTNTSTHRARSRMAPAAATHAAHSAVRPVFWGSCSSGARYGKRGTHRTQHLAPPAALPDSGAALGAALFFAPGLIALAVALVKGKGNVRDGLSRMLTELSQGYFQPDVGGKSIPVSQVCASKCVRRLTDDHDTWVAWLHSSLRLCAATQRTTQYIALC
jgi:hypothetical protein